MRNIVLDIRESTCRGGGALWAFLSHVREVPRGGTLELLTDDGLARNDIPEWVRHEGWRLESQKDEAGAIRFVVRRPYRRPR